MPRPVRKRLDAQPAQHPPLPPTTAQAAVAELPSASPATDIIPDSQPINGREIIVGNDQDVVPAATTHERPSKGNNDRATTRGRGRSSRDVSGMDLTDDEDGAGMFGDLDTTLDDSNLDSPAVAPSAETSSFNVSLFKRTRRRASSMASREDGPIRPSSRAGNTTGLSTTFNLGLFKRRAREPSILGRSRRPRAESQEPASDLNSDIDGGAASELDVDSTSLEGRKAGAVASVAAASESEASSPRRTRKRKSAEDHGSVPKRLAASSDNDVRHSIEAASSPLASEARLPSLPSTPIRHIELDDSILAPPVSSGSESASPLALPSLNSLAHGSRRDRPQSRQKTPAIDNDLSDLSSPPSLTHSPNFRPTRAAAKPKQKAAAPRAPSPVTTAALSALLPRRRNKANDAGEESAEEVSALGLEHDELSYGASRPNKPARPLGTTNVGQGAKTKSSKPVRRTYGTRNASDKENQDGDEGDSIEVGASPLPDDAFDTPEDDEGNTTLDPTDELKHAGRKFKEVDKWELEFEEVTMTSSPKDSR